jgi:hypothetical protein
VTVRTFWRCLFLRQAGLREPIPPSLCLAAFFSALNHLESIRESSVALVAGRDQVTPRFSPSRLLVSVSSSILLVLHSQALGLELLDHSSALFSRAMDATLDWAQARCQDADTLQVSNGLVGAGSSCVYIVSLIASLISTSRLRCRQTSYLPRLMLPSSNRLRCVRCDLATLLHWLVRSERHCSEL